MKESFVDKNFSFASRTIIKQADDIIRTYQEDGYVLTLRQLYYQFVSRDLIVNTVQSYKRLGSIINDARLAGLLDWSAIEDRTRNLNSLAHWNSASEILSQAHQQFRMDKWANQPKAH